MAAARLARPRLITRLSREGILHTKVALKRKQWPLDKGGNREPFVCVGHHGTLRSRYPDGLEIRERRSRRAVKASVADIRNFALDRKYSLVYLVFNTIEGLTSQDEQVACFENAAAHLQPGGRFVIENVVPDVRRISPDNTAVPFTVTDDYIGINDDTDPTHRQLFRSRHLFRRSGRSFAEFRTTFRFVWPSELDLMARLAGMTLEHRWSSWDRSPFTG